MKRLSIVAILFTTLSLQSLQAENSKSFTNSSKNSSLIELYTSEGCHSCPPAEKYIYGLKNHSNLFKLVFPIVFHVNYWDYLGWKDQLAQEKYTTRQRKLARLSRSNTIYTPGVYNNSNKWPEWRKRSNTISSRQLTQGKLTAEVKGDQVSIRYSALSNSSKKPAAKQQKQSPIFDFHFVVLGQSIKTKIQSGERTGETVEHDFAVLALKKKSSSQTVSFSIKSELANFKGKAIVVWVTQKGSEKPLQITGGYI